MPAVPRPPGPAGGTLRLARALRADPTGFLPSLRDEFGDAAYLRLGPERLYVFSHPDQVREILVTKGRSFRKGRGLESARMLLGDGLLTSEGAFHLRQRRLAQPAFSAERIAAYADVFVSCAGEAAGRWRDGARVDMAAEMSALTLDAVGRTLFGSDVRDDAPGVSAALATVMRSFDRIVSPLAMLTLRLPTRRNRDLRRARAKLDATIYRLLARRRAEPPGDRGDLLSILVTAVDEETGGMTDRQLRDEAMTLFLAGHETTADALSWTWLLLSREPDVAKRLHEEVDRVLGGRAPAYADLAALPYAGRVVAEAMRLYPPAWVLGRRAVEDVEIGGWPVPRRSLVLVSQWVVHRDPRWWPRPEEFDPDRWAEDAGDRPRFAYFPFGGGGRVCIGESFAWLEATLVLAALARDWAPAHDGPPAGVEPSITLRPRGGLPMTLRAR